MFQYPVVPVQRGRAFSTQPRVVSDAIEENIYFYAYTYTAFSTQPRVVSDAMCTLIIRPKPK